MPNLIDLVLLGFWLTALCTVGIGLWRCIHGLVTQGWKGGKFRSGIGLMFGGGALVFLTAILVPRGFHQNRPQGQLTACRSNLKNIATAIAMYQEDHSGRLPQTLAELAPNFLREIPTCPAAGKDTYTATFVSREARGSEPEFYRFHCEGSHHLKANVTHSDRPAYTSVEGLLER